MLNLWWWNVFHTIFNKMLYKILSIHILVALRPNTYVIYKLAFYKWFERIGIFFIMKDLHFLKSLCIAIFSFTTSLHFTSRQIEVLFYWALSSFSRSIKNLFDFCCFSSASSSLQPSEFLITIFGNIFILTKPWNIYFLTILSSHVLVVSCKNYNIFSSKWNTPSDISIIIIIFIITIFFLCYFFIYFEIKKILCSCEGLQICNTFCNLIYL